MALLKASYGRDTLRTKLQDCNKMLVIAFKEIMNCLQVLTAVLGREEQHSLESNDWMYWELQLTQEAASVLVQLNRSAGDPVLFLKPAGAGFLVSLVPPRGLSTCQIEADM